MQQGSLIRSARKRGPDVWQFRWADRGPYGKRIHRKRVIGTACQYADADSARRAVTGLLREINANVFQRCHLPMTVAEVCDHFVQRELTKDNSWRSYSTKKAYRAYLNRWVIRRAGDRNLVARNRSNMVCNSTSPWAAAMSNAASVPTTCNPRWRAIVTPSRSCINNGMAWSSEARDIASRSLRRDVPGPNRRAVSGSQLPTMQEAAKSTRAR